MGVFAEVAAYVGLSGEPDEQIWNYALENDSVVVTSNARDFIRLLNVEVHPGSQEPESRGSRHFRI